MIEPAFANTPRPNRIREGLQVAICGIVLTGLLYAVCYALENFKSNVKKQAAGRGVVQHDR